MPAVQIWVDPYTLRVAGLTSERWHGIVSESEKNSLPLRTLRQISDVILVDSAAAALYQAPPAAMRLVGLPVKTAAGMTLGKASGYVLLQDWYLEPADAFALEPGCLEGRGCPSCPLDPNCQSYLMSG